VSPRRTRPPAARGGGARRVSKRARVARLAYLYAPGDRAPVRTQGVTGFREHGPWTYGARSHLGPRCQRAAGRCGWAGCMECV
jgi:hypothetical protein